MAGLRSLAVALAVFGVWLLCDYQSRPHSQAVADRPAGEFSAARAEAVLSRILGSERPDPLGSANNVAVRGRILREFAALGVPARSYRAFTCFGRLGFVACGTVTDIIAEVVPGEGKAIVLMAHYDSVPAGPGASDDKSGVAAVLETVRALKARNERSLHPVIALITDGEEAGLLGANAFLENTALRSRVGVVVNMEGRGASGPSLLFQTSPGDGKLVDLYARNVPVAAASSLYAEIYKVLPNDTDLTPFLRAGFPAYNFAFIGDVRYYHSPLDVRGRLDPATMQMHGDNLLGLTAALEKTDYAALAGGDAVYINVLNAMLPRLPRNWALSFAILVFLGVALAAWLARRGPLSWRDAARAAVMPLAMIAGCAAIGFLLAWIARAISGQPDPTYAYPGWMRLGLGLGVSAVALVSSRLTGLRGAAASAWIWIAGLGVLAAALVPGISPYFTFPSCVAAVLLLAVVHAPGGWSGRWGQGAITLCAFAALVVWLPLLPAGETIMGLGLHEIFTIPAAFGLMTAVPLLADAPLPRRAWAGAAACLAVLSLACAVVQGFQPAYSTASPQRANILLFQAGHGPARWIVSTSWKAKGTEPPPPQMVKAMGLKFDENAYGGLKIGNGFGAVGSAYVAPAGPAIFAPPAAEIVANAKESPVHSVGLRLAGSPLADAMLLAIPRDAKLKAMDIRGEHVTVDWRGGTLVTCLSPDCRDLDLTLTMGAGTHPILSFAEQRYGLAALGRRVTALRPATAMASQSGDGIILANEIALP